MIHAAGRKSRVEAAIAEESWGPAFVCSCSVKLEEAETPLSVLNLFFTPNLWLVHLAPQ